MSKDKGEDAFFDQFCQNVRRFTDYHISSMLHSLIGLPSMVTPPSGQTWVIIDEEARPKKERAYSDGDGRLEGKTMEEIQKLKATWIAERDGNEQGSLETVGVGKIKAESESSTSSSSSSSSSFPASPGSDRAIYVFRFPSSYPRYGFSDFPCPDAYQQVERLNSHMRHSFFDDDFFPLGVQSFFGFLHPFMFSPSAELPRLHDYRHHPSLKEGVEDFDIWKRMRDQEIRCAREMYGHLYNDSRTSLGIRTQENDRGQATSSKREPPKSLLPPSSPSHSWETKQEKEFQSEPSTELDLYEHLNSVNSNLSKEDSSLATRKPGAPRVISASSSTESRTLPDGSSFTKIIKITRYEDGTEQKIEDVHTTPPREDSCPVLRDRDSSPGILSSVLDQEDRLAAHNVDRMGERMLEYLMQSPLFEDVKRSGHLFRQDNSLGDEEPHESKQATRISERSGPDCMPQQTQMADKDEENRGKWGWFWKK